jgi:hypothetical protein
VQEAETGTEKLRGPREARKAEKDVREILEGEFEVRILQDNGLATAISCIDE